MAGVSIEVLGQKLRLERGGRGIREIAREIGVSAATLSRVERGNLPDLETFAKLCEWLKIDPSTILGLENVTDDEPSGRVVANAHFRAEAAPSPELAGALAEMILAAERMLIERRGQ